MALHDMTSGDFTHDTQNTYTHNKHRVRMRPPKGVWQVTWQVSDNLGVSCVTLYNLELSYLII